jgi:hypothetical protein
MGALLHLFAVRLLVCNGSITQNSSSTDDCAGSQTCTDTEPYKSAPLTPPNALMDFSVRMIWEEKVDQIGGHSRCFQKRAWKRCVQQNVFRANAFHAEWSDWYASSISTHFQTVLFGEIQGYGQQGSCATDLLLRMSERWAGRINGSRLHILYVVAQRPVVSRRNHLPWYHLHGVYVELATSHCRVERREPGHVDQLGALSRSGCYH